MEPHGASWGWVGMDLVIKARSYPDMAGAGGENRTREAGGVLSPTQVEQPVLLGPAQPLGGCLATQSCRLGTAVGQLHGKPAVGIPGGFAGRMGLQPLRDVMGNARAERTV